MSNEAFPRVLGHIAKLGLSNEDLRKVFFKLERALQENETMRKAKDELKKDADNLLIDVMLIRQADTIAQEQREESTKCLQMLETCYSHLLEIVGFLEDDRFNNIMRFSILSKQNEVQEELNRIDEQQKKDWECKVAMENRKIVKEFRKWQQLLKDSEEESLSIELELQQLNRQWQIKMDRAILQRNKKIVSLVELSKQISDAQTFKVPKPFVAKIAKRAVVTVGRSNPSVLQSAMEFLRKLQLENKVVKEVQQPLRPILVVNRSQEDADNIQPSSSKQVHFAPLPSPLQLGDSNSLMAFETKVHEMTDDDDDDKVSAPPEFDCSNLPERPIIERVDVLPSLNFSLASDECSNFASEPNNPSKSMESLSFKNKFSPFNSEDVFNTKPSMEVQFHSSEQSTDNSESNNINESNTLNFSTPKKNCDSDFFLNFDDDDSEDLPNAYDL